MKRIMIGLVAFSLVLGIAAPLSAHANPDKVEEIRAAAKARAEERRQQKDERIAEIKEEVAARKLELQQDRCERRQEKLAALLPKLSNGATRVKGAIDKVYERVQGFYDSGQLTVDNYDELVEAIELAKANAESSLEALDSFEFEIDCEENGVGGQLDGYRTAVKGAKEDLKAYRKSVVALISSLKAEAAEHDSGDDNGDESTDEGADTENEQQEAENE